MNSSEQAITVSCPDQELICLSGLTRYTSTIVISSPEICAAGIAVVEHLVPLVQLTQLDTVARSKIVAAVL